MKKLTVILLFASIFGYAQIDYKGLVKNLEEVTIDTDVKEYLKGLPFEEEYDDIKFNDERFLRFYGVIVNKVKFKNGWSGKTMDITPFDEKEDYEKMKAKLTEIYGDPEINERSNRIGYTWETDKLEIRLNINFEENEGEEDEEIKQKGAFKEFEDLTISFKEQ